MVEGTGRDTSSRVWQGVKRVCAHLCRGRARLCHPRRRCAKMLVHEVKRAQMKRHRSRKALLGFPATLVGLDDSNPRVKALQAGGRVALCPAQVRRTHVQAWRCCPRRTRRRCAGRIRVGLPQNVYIPSTFAVRYSTHALEPRVLWAREHVVVRCGAGSPLSLQRGLLRAGYRDSQAMDTLPLGLVIRCRVVVRARVCSCLLYTSDAADE